MLNVGSHGSSPWGSALWLVPGGLPLRDLPGFIKLEFVFAVLFRRGLSRRSGCTPWGVTPTNARSSSPSSASRVGILGVGLEVVVPEVPGVASAVTSRSAAAAAPTKMKFRSVYLHRPSGYYPAGYVQCLPGSPSDSASKRFPVWTNFPLGGCPPCSSRP